MEKHKDYHSKAKQVVLYPISSLPDDAERLGKMIRAHWDIENSLHYVLDVAFNKDQSRARSWHSDENLVIIRRFALNILKHNKICKLGSKK